MYERIKRLCEVNGISIHQLEIKCGISNGTIGRWDGIKSSPKLMTIMLIADFFEISIDELVYGRNRYAKRDAAK